jgi:drug/metabolite transporter (DMT)-like permease
MLQSGIYRSDSVFEPERRFKIGPLFALLSTISFGLADAGTRRGVLGIPAFLGIHVTIFVGFPLVVIAAAVTGQLFELANLSAKSFILLAAAGSAQMLVGAYALYRCFGVIGANRATPMRSIAVPITLLMAFVVLGERVSAMNGIGILIVVLAPTVMLQRERKVDPIGSSKLLEGYFFALISGLAFGISPVMIREAIGGTGLGIAGALVGYSAAAGVLLLGLAYPGRLASLQGMDRTALRWFLVNAVTVVFAQMFTFVAFDLAPVTVVTPLMRTTAIWTVIFGFLINRQLEAFGPRVMGAIALSVVGSIFVVL